jgi:NADH-quinone oxidoreductase subunit C
MRKYTPKDNVQKKSYYTDRFYVSPELPKEDVTSDEVFAKDVESLKSKFDILESYIEKEQLVVVANDTDNKAIVQHLRDELEYDFLCELSAIDYLADRGEFEVFYQMLSTSKRKRMRLKVALKENHAIESVESLFRCADWAERECYDMYGVVFNNHPYLKRILMPDDWQGYPLRKSYPLQGDEFAQWYEVDKIFGKEYRDIIGPEIRDAAMIDRYDTERFARLGQEVPFGMPHDSDTINARTAEDGYSDNNPLVTDFKEQKILDERK